MANFSEHEAATYLLQQIEEAFVDLPIPSRGDLLLADRDDGESRELRAKFGGRHWLDLTPDELAGEADALSFFTPVAYRFLLPAFLRFVVLDPERADLICDVVLWKLLPYESTVARDELAQRGLTHGLPSDLVREACRPPDPLRHEAAAHRRALLDSGQRQAVRGFVDFLRRFRSEEYDAGYLEAVEAALRDGRSGSGPEAR